MAENAAAERIFRTERTIWWGHADMAAIINMPRAFDFAGEVIEEFLRDRLGFTFRQMIQEKGFDLPFVHASCDYSAPLIEGESFDMTLQVGKLGTKSITWIVTAYKKDGEQAFKTTLVNVVLDHATGLSMPIPNAVRVGLTPYLIEG